MIQALLADTPYARLVRGERDRPGLPALAQRLLSFTELENLLATIRPDAPQRQLADALGVRFEFKGLENLAAAGDRPVILFANHPTGGGNVLGMSVLLADHFSDYRILGNQHMRFVPHLSETLIPVDPFRSGAAINMDALLTMRREFGTKYRALGVFPAGISSHWSFSRATITDRRWSDAFIRIARHHDALLVPVWFSGRNRLRYYMAARIRKELGFLALPAEFLRLRGKTIEVVVGEPISPDLLRHIPERRAQMSFVRASVYELGRQHGTSGAPADKVGLGPRAIGVEPPRPLAPIPVGEKLEARLVERAPIAGLEQGAAHGSAALDRASYHMVLTRRGSSVPLAHWQALDWAQFTDAELDRISPIRKSFRLPPELSAARRNWLEIVDFRLGKELGGLAALRPAWRALKDMARAIGPRTELVGLLTPRNSGVALASVSLGLLQKCCGDDALLRARPEVELLGATRHHDWRPHRDIGSLDRRAALEQARLLDPLLGSCARLGVRFGASGLRAGSPLRPCILARLGCDAWDRLPS
jgi:putative hemolysin